MLVRMSISVSVSVYGCRSVFTHILSSLEMLTMMPVVMALSLGGTANNTHPNWKLQHEQFTKLLRIEATDLNPDALSSTWMVRGYPQS